MLNSLTCEAVRIDDGGPSPAFYPVSILDVDLMKDLPMVYLKSEGGWLPEEWYPLEDCQLFQPPAQRSLEELQERLKVPGCCIQVFRKAKASAPAAWYRGVVVSESNGIYSVDLQLVPVHRIQCMAKHLRLAQDPLPLTRDSIERVLLPVPPDAIGETTNEHQLQLFAQYGQFQFVQYDAQSNAIVVLVYGKSAARRAEILYQFHTMHARKRQKLRDEISQLRNDIRDAQTTETVLFRCEFTIPPECFVGAQLKRARQIFGIVRILADGNGRFVITANSEAAMNKAREILEIVTDVVYVDQPLVGRIIGKQGVNVKSIVKTTAIIKLFVHTDLESARSAGVDVEWKEGFAVCVITGSRSATEAAKMLVDCQVDHKRQMNEAFMLRRQQSRRGGLSRKAREDRISTGSASTDDGERSSHKNEQRAGQRNKKDHVDSQIPQENDNRRRRVSRGVYHGRGRRNPGLPTREERGGSMDASSPAEPLKRAAEEEPRGHMSKRCNINGLLVTG